MKMPNLSKEEIKKVVLSLLGLIALLYCYSVFLLAPLNQARARMISATADDEQKLADGKKTIEQAARLEQDARNSHKTIAIIEKLTSPGAPVAWFPPLIKTFFATDQIEIGHAQLNSTTDFKEPELATYSKTDWVIDVPHADFLLLGLSIARLENERPSAKITDMHIQAIQDKPEFQSVTFRITMIVKK